MVSEDGYADLAWALKSNITVEFYKLTETYNGVTGTHFIDHPNIRVYRIEPGNYEFRVQACRRSPGGYPDCGKESKSLILTVNEDAADLQPGDVVRLPMPPGESRSSSAFSPGHWYNPDRNGHGWSFYWSNRLALPTNDPQHGDVWDLQGLWYTYEAKQRYLAGPAGCETGAPGFGCYIAYEDYRPIAARLQLIRVGEDRYEGSVFFTRSGQEINQGSVSLTFWTNTRASLEWTANFKWRQLSASEEIRLLAGGVFDSTDNHSHYSGLWEPAASGDYLVSHDLGKYSEAVEVVFEDEQGDPTWLLGVGDLPSPGPTDLCFTYVSSGFEPGTAGTLQFYDDGCDSNLSPSGNNRNGHRRFTGFESELFWVDFELPGGSVTGGISAGSSDFLQGLSKRASFHRISYDSAEGSTCEISALKPECTVSLTWFSDGKFPSTSAFVRELSSGSRDLISTSIAMQDFQFLLDSPGEYEFELRMGSEPDSTLMAVSDRFFVDEDATPTPQPEADPDVPPDPVSQPNFSPSVSSSQTGVTAGEFAVTPYGSASYRIPILTAPGSGELAPEISLEYDSQGGNGSVGAGWRLAGISIIGRCPQTIEQDGISIPGEVAFTADDRFCLDGERLMAVDGLYGAPGTEYRKERDDFTRVISYGQVGSGPQYFRAWSRDGVLREFGGSSDSRIEARGAEAAGTVFAWAQNRTEDTAGNYLEYAYLENSAGPVDFVIESVRYTGNTNAGSLPYAEISFSYDSGRADTGLAFTSGVGATHTRLLTRIDSTSRVDANSPAEYLRSYQLGYGLDGWGRKALESVTECRDPSQAVCFPPSSFEWLRSKHGFGGNGMSLDNVFSDSFRGLNLADINGDGRQDLLVSEAISVKYQFGVALSNANGGFDMQTERFSLASGDEPGRAAALASIDLNADGYQDVMFPRGAGSDIDWFARLGSPTGLGDEVPVIYNCCELRSPFMFLVLDFNGDGLSDVLTHAPNESAPGAGDLLLHINSFQPGDPNPSFEPGRILSVDIPNIFPYSTASGWWVDDNVPLFDVQSYRDIPGKVHDFNGDGRVDMLVRLTQRYYRCDGPCQIPRGGISQGSTFAFGTLGEYTSSSTRAPEDTAYATAYLVLFADSGDRYSANETVAIGEGDRCDVPEVCIADELTPAVRNMLVVDINADGLADLAYNDSAYDWHFRLNAGNGFLEPVPMASPPNDERSDRGRFTDIDGDGYPDFMYPSLLDSDDSLWVLHSNLFGTAFAGPQTPYIPSGNSAQADVSLMHDFTGDAMADHLYIDWRADGGGPEPGGSRLYTGRNTVSGNVDQAINAVLSFENGLGARHQVSYLPLTDQQVYTRLNSSANANWGDGSVVYDLSAPIQVVASSSASAPVFGNPDATNLTRYHYAGARLQAGGRGFLGFAELVEFDVQNNLRTNTRFRQDFPFTGRVVERVISHVSSSWYQFDLTTDISQNMPETWTQISAGSQPPAVGNGSTIVRYEIQELASAESVPGTGAQFISTPAELSRQYSLSGGFKQKALKTRAYDGYGNILGGMKEVFDEDDDDPWSVVVTANQWLIDTVQWRLGRLSSLETTHWREGEPVIERSSHYQYDGATGLLVREIEEPDDPDWRVVTEYQLDAFGNRASVTKTGSGMAPRTASQVYDALGRFAVQSINAYNQLTSQTARWDVFGNPLETLNIDGVSLLNWIDLMGRITGSYAETGSWSRIDSGLGSHAQCPAGTVSYTLTTGGGIPDKVSCFDQLGRELRTVTEGFLGSWIYVDSYFDASGRPERTSEPYFSGQSRLWNRINYDALGRPSLSIAASGLEEHRVYDDEAQHCGASHPRALLRTVYTGEGTEQRYWEGRNTDDEVVQAVDNNCGSVENDYDAPGNLIRVTGIDGSVIQIHYDSHGRHKTSVDDPDKGLWQYRLNPLGEVIRQLDGQQQAIDFEYDLLGRVTDRRELTGVGSLFDQQVQVVNHEVHQWQNSTSTGVKGKGQMVVEEYLAGESGQANHSRQYAYDEFGRITQVTHAFQSQQFIEQTTYDQFGRVFQQFDASGDYRGIRLHYNPRGYVEIVQEAREGPNGRVYKQVLNQDARGNTTAAVLGNGVALFAEYDPGTGLARTLEAYDAAGQEMQFVEYDFDLHGNLRSRHDRSGNQNLREDFEYDALNRLERVMLTAPALGMDDFETQQMSYSPSGNVTYKSGVGGYVYGQYGAGPHAVTSAGGVTYTYDASGNQISSSDGRTISYTVFDKPQRIQKGLDYTEFTYGLGNSRFKRVDDNAVDGQKTTWTVGNVDYVEAVNGSPYYKRQVGAETLVEFYPANETTIEWYINRDHLGSIHSMSDGSGTQTSAFHFDPWGARQAVNWQDLLQPAEQSTANATTNKGFTGHEHADGLGVIHMNGRIYDPRLGRFLQADPFVQAPRIGQSLNRYSYALNNPLSYTDPSGYFFKRLIRKWGRTIAALVASYFTYGWASGWASGFLSASGAAAVGGAAAGLVGGAMITGTIKGALRGAFAGAIGGGIAGYFQDTYDTSRILAESVGGGLAAEIQGEQFRDGLMFAALASSATYLTVRLRAYQIAQSQQFPAQIGESDGFRGIPGKLAGERIYEDIWVGSGAAWEYLSGEPLEVALERYLKARQEFGPLSPLGCLQSGPGCAFGIPYKPNGFVDYVLEAYAGVHDTLNQPFFYNSNGTNKLPGGFWRRAVGKALNLTNILLATPIVIPSLLPEYMRPLLIAEPN